MGQGELTDGDSIWLARLTQGSTLHYGVAKRKPWYPLDMPFYRGDHRNVIPADDVCSVITPHTPSTGSLEYAFDVTYWAMPVIRSNNRRLLTHNSNTIHS